MGFFFGLFLAPFILFLVFVAPIWIVAHYLTRWRTAKTMTSDEERVMEEVWRGLERMEDRVRSIERILDEGDPDWRRRN